MVSDVQHAARTIFQGMRWTPGLPDSGDPHKTRLKVQSLDSKLWILTRCEMLGLHDRLVWKFRADLKVKIFNFTEVTSVV